MRYFLDTEFIDDGKTIDLISIGIVSEYGAEFYRVSRDFNLDKCTQWLIDNVIKNLIRDTDEWVFNNQIANDILAFLGNDSNIEFWGYYPSYDWVVFCQLFGPMIELPKPLPHRINDLKQLMNFRKQQFSQTGAKHNALLDALWIKETYEKLM